MVLLCAAPAAGQVRQVLMLQSFDRGTVTLDTFTDSFRIALTQRSPQTVVFVQFVVNPSGFEVSPDRAIVDYLQTAFADRPKPDLVVTIGGPAAAFARRYRPHLFPKTPLLFAAFDQRFLAHAPLGANEASVGVANDMVGLMEDVLRLFPRTSNVFMITGSGTLGRSWQADLDREFERFKSRLKLTWSNELSYTEIMRQVRVLPPNSAIFYLHLGVDGVRAAYSEDRVLADLHAAANAPIFGTQSPQLGRGIVGGRLMPTEALALTAADVAFRMLNGESPGSIEPTIGRPARAAFDWRELRRWGVDRRLLPPDSDVRFEELSVWDRFKWLIIASGTAMAAQTMLIATLLVTRAKQRRAEQSLRESEGRFRLMANTAPVMLRMSGPDLKCTDFNLSWLAFTGRPLDVELGNGWIEGVHPDDRVACIEAYRRACTRRDQFRHEYRLRRFDGEYRWVLDSGVPRFTPDGTFSGYIDSAIDVTDLKAARATLSSLNRRLFQAQEKERSRLARELHDDVCQRMTLLAIDLDQLGKALPDGAADARGRVRELNDAVAALGSDIQGISHRLHSSKLEYLGLAAAARGFCREVSAQRGVPIEFEQENVPTQLPPDLALNLFRVLQEALTNAVKHSGAEQYRVSLRAADDVLHLEIADAGRGFDVDAALASQGLGLVSMQERIKLVQGEMVVDSTPGHGTTVRVRVPLGARTADAADAADAGAPAPVS
jgi:PAS domain S-box-containing protein